MLALAVLLQATTYVPAVPHAPAIPPDPAYAKCAGADAILAQASDLTWTSVKSTIDEHRAIRAKIGVPLPEAPERVLWYASGGDLGTTTFSVVATRADAGLWHVNGVGQSEIWIQGAKPIAMPRINRTMTAEESSRFDALIADPCLAAGPTFANNPRIAAGGLYNSLEIETAGKRWVGGWHGMPTPQEIAIADVMGKH